MTVGPNVDPHKIKKIFQTLDPKQCRLYISKHKIDVNQPFQMRIGSNTHFVTLLYLFARNHSFNKDVHRNSEMIKILLTLNADPNFMAEGMTPLHWAVIYKDAEKVKALLVCDDALIDVKATSTQNNCQGKTAYAIAKENAQGEDCTIIDQLILHLFEERVQRDEQKHLHFHSTHQHVVLLVSSKSYLPSDGGALQNNASKYVAPPMNMGPLRAKL